MRKEAGSTILIAITMCSCLLQCISMPSAPASETPECVGRFFTTRREVKEVQEKNYAYQAAMGLVGAMGLWLPVLLLVPMVGGTTMQLKHRAEADGITQDWQERHCKTGSPWARAPNPAPGLQ